MVALSVHKNCFSVGHPVLSLKEDSDRFVHLHVLSVWGNFYANNTIWQSFSPLVVVADESELIFAFIICY